MVKDTNQKKGLFFFLKRNKIQYFIFEAQPSSLIFTIEKRHRIHEIKIVIIKVIMTTTTTT